MPALPVSPKDVGAIVREKSALYQPEGKRVPGDPATQDKPTQATPFNIKALLDQLDLYTKAVQEAANQEGLTEDANVQQWALDMSNWQYRLAHYYEVLRMLPPEQAETLAGADAIYFQVTAPLLDGVYYEVLPGIMLNDEERQRIANGEGSNPKPPGVFYPFTLGNQVVEYRNHQRERWEKLWEDLKDGFKRLGLPPGVDPWWWIWRIVVTAASGLAGGTIVYTGIQVAEFRRRRALARLARAA
jgi:hypothetical protein